MDDEKQKGEENDPVVPLAEPLVVQLAEDRGFQFEDNFDSESKLDEIANRFQFEGNFDPESKLDEIANELHFGVDNFVSDFKLDEIENQLQYDDDFASESKLDEIANQLQFEENFTSESKLDEIVNELKYTDNFASEFKFNEIAKQLKCIENFASEAKLDEISKQIQFDESYTSESTLDGNESQLQFEENVVSGSKEVETANQLHLEENVASGSKEDEPANRSIYKWIDRKPLTEAVTWTSREKFWLITAICHYGIHDWKSVAQVVRNSGEPYRPREWYTTKSCERQFKIIVSNYSKEMKLPFNDMLRHIAECLKFDYIRDANKSKDNLKAKYCSLFNVLNRVKQGNLSRQEIVNLYSHARRNEVEGKQYVDQLMKRQNASLATENLNSSLSEESIKWNTPSAPLLTSLLRSRNTIPANRTVTTITSLLQSPGGTSRTRSGKLLPLSTSVKTQGTPTLSKLLEAPANPYIPSPTQSVQKTKQIDVAGADKVLVGNTSRKENLQSATLNRVQIDTITSASVNQINKSDLSNLKKQMPKSPISAVKTGSKENLNVVDLLSDSENEEDNTNSIQNIHSNNLFGEKKDTVISIINNCNISRLEQRATRSQTRAESGFKQLNDSKLFDMQKERDNLQELSEGPQLTDTNLIEDELIDIDQIEVEPLSVHDEIITQTTPKFIRSCIQRPYSNNSVQNILTSKVNSKEISNRMLEEISANFVLNSSIKTVSTEYKNVMVGQSHIDDGNISGSFFPVDDSAVTDAILLCKDGQSILNSGNTLNKTLLNKKRIIELKGTNIRCDDARNDTKMLSFLNQPIVVRNKIKTPLKVKPTSGEKIDVNMLVSNDLKKPTRLKTVAQLFGRPQPLSDEVIIIDDDDCRTPTKNKELPSKNNLKSLPLTVIEATHSSNPGNSTSSLHLDEKKTRDNKPWKMFGKTNNILNLSSRNLKSQDGATKSGNNSRISHTSNQFIKELDFDFDHSISQTSLSELYNGVEEIVEEMHSFDNEELNSLIECGSLDNSETEVRENIINLDQGDSSVSGSDSTIGVFDTFAQITGVSLKSSTSKGIKSFNRKSKIANDGKDFNGDEGFVQSRDDQISTVSVTGIPILQGVISDVMSKIDSDRVATHKEVVSQNISSDEIVEISSDEEEIVPNPIQFSSNNPGQKKISNKEVETYKSNDHELNKVQELESTFIIEVDDDTLETDSIGTKTSENNIPKEINNVVNVHEHDTVNSKSHSFNINKTKTENIQTIKEIEMKDSKTKENQINCLSNNDNELIKTNKIKENKLMGSRVNTEFKCLKGPGPFKLPQEIAREFKDSIIENMMVSEDDTCKNTKEKIINVKGATENNLESELIKRLKKPEIKRVNETTLNDEFEAEIMQRANKKNEIKKIIEVKKFENKRFKEIDIMKVEKKRVEEAKIKRIKAYEMKRAKEAEMKRAKEAESKRAQEAEIKRDKEVEMMRAKEAENNRAKAAEIKRATEAENKRAEEAEIKRAKEAEIQKATELEIQKAIEIERREREAEIKRKKVEELQRAEEESRKIKEAEARRRAIEEDKRRKKEMDLRKAELKKAKEAEIKKAKEEADVRKAIEIEQRKAAELLQSKRKEENVTKKKEAELKIQKDLEVREAELIRKSQGAKSKAKEMEIRKIVEKASGKLLKSKHVSAFDNKPKKLQQVFMDKKKNSVKKIEIMKQKEQESKNAVENVVRKPKEDKTTIMTRKRILRTEKKSNIKHCTSCNHFTTEPLGNTSSKCSLFDSKISSTSNNYRKQISNLPDKQGNLISKSKKIYKDKVGSSKGSSASIKKISFKRKFSFKSRTRSSSLFKHGKIVKSKSKFPQKSKYSEIESTLKLTKKNSTINLPNKFMTCDIPIASGYNSKNSIKLVRKEAAKRLINKEMNVPVVVVNTNKVTEYKERLAEMKALKNAENNDSSKTLDLKIANTEEKLQKKIDVGEKPAPKKRGRKRKIDLENEKLQQFKKDNETNKNSQLPKVFEPPAKRTRRSKDICEIERNSEHNTADTPLINEPLSKEALNILLSSLHGLKKIEKHLKNLSENDASIIKKPVFIEDIKKQINTGQIKTMSQLDLCVYSLLLNASFTTIPGSKVSRDINTFIEAQKCVKWKTPYPPTMSCVVTRKTNFQAQYNFSSKRKIKVYDSDEEDFNAYLKNKFGEIFKEHKDVSGVDRKCSDTYRRSQK